MYSIQLPVLTRHAIFPICLFHVFFNRIKKTLWKLEVILHWIMFVAFEEFLRHRFPLSVDYKAMFIKSCHFLDRNSLLSLRIVTLCCFQYPCIHDARYCIKTENRSNENSMEGSTFHIFHVPSGHELIFLFIKNCSNWMFLIKLQNGSISLRPDDISNLYNANLDFYFNVSEWMDGIINHQPFPLHLLESGKKHDGGEL